MTNIVSARSYIVQPHFLVYRKKVGTVRILRCGEAISDEEIIVTFSGHSPSCIGRKI